jgi:hypothetical protein
MIWLCCSKGIPFSKTGCNSPQISPHRFQQGSNSHDVFGGSGLGRKYPVSFVHIRSSHEESLCVKKTLRPYERPYRREFLDVYLCLRFIAITAIQVDSVYGKGATFRFFIQASNSPMGPEAREDPWSISDTRAEISDRRISRDVRLVPSERSPPPQSIFIPRHNCHPLTHAL